MRRRFAAIDQESGERLFHCQATYGLIDNPPLRYAWRLEKEEAERYFDAAVE